MTVEGNPFSSNAFFSALEKSGSIGPDKGWKPVAIDDLITYEKAHSYGEYIFDWSWADAYERYGIPYYPKLTSMVPFSPVTYKHFKNHVTLKEHDKFYEEGPYSSAHFLFLEKDELPYFKQQNYFLRETLQYHFFNDGFRDFEHFLSALKGKKAKNIRKERSFTGISFKRLTGEELTSEHAHRMYQFYMSTIIQKNSFDYLNLRFFEEVFHTLKDNIMYIEASDSNGPMGGSLFFFGGGKLYGRYWGATKFIENLHFELCYYQGIDFCIENKFSIFEAGAQGEHKISRGFRPVKIHSAHKIKHPAFQKAIGNFIEKETEYTGLQLTALSELLPFKK